MDGDNESADFSAIAGQSFSSVLSNSSDAARSKHVQSASQHIRGKAPALGGSARDPLLSDSIGMKTNPNHLVHDVSGEYGSVDTNRSRLDSLNCSVQTDFGSDIASREYVVRPGLGGIQFADPDSTTVSGEYVNIQEGDSERTMNPTTLALQKCKRTVVKPYLKLLSVLGWFPIIPDNGTGGRLTRAVNIIYPIVPILLVLLAYILQFAACFRRDGAYLVNNTTVECYSNAIGTYLIPDLLHSAAYGYAFYLFRLQQSENLVTLMERVFLQSSLGQSGYPPEKLIWRLRALLYFVLCWVLMSLVNQIIHVVGIAILPSLEDNVIIPFTWLNAGSSGTQVFLVILMLIGFIALDIVYAAIVINYATHCELLIIMLRSMSSRVLQKTTSLQDVMREIMVAQKYLKYINENVATAVSLLMFNFGAAIVIGIQSAVRQHAAENPFTNGTLFAATIISIALWGTLFMTPLIQAARLSTACWSLGKIGQEVATRPYGFQSSPQDELNAFLTFTTSLQLRAKLFRIPMRPAYLLAVFVTGGFVFMVLLATDPGLFNLDLTV